MIKFHLNIIVQHFKEFVFETLVRVYEILHIYSSKNDTTKSQINKCVLGKYKIIYLMSYLKSVLTKDEIKQLIEEIRKEK